MLTDSPAGRRWSPPLTGRLPDDAGAEAVARAMRTIWAEIDLVLHPIIGHRGVVALYDRSLKLAAEGHPWLLAEHRPAGIQIDLTGLCNALALQDADQAGAGAEAVFAALLDLLQSLVGPALSERLLLPVWALPPPSPPVQDPMP
jgi:hypothetical protein